MKRRHITARKGGASAPPFFMSSAGDRLFCAIYWLFCAIYRRCILQFNAFIPIYKMREEKRKGKSQKRKRINQVKSLGNDGTAKQKVLDPRPREKGKRNRRLLAVDLTLFQGTSGSSLDEGCRVIVEIDTFMRQLTIPASRAYAPGVPCSALFFAASNVAVENRRIVGKNLVR